MVTTVFCPTHVFLLLLYRLPPRFEKEENGELETLSVAFSAVLPFIFETIGGKKGEPVEKAGLAPGKGGATFYTPLHVPKGVGWPRQISFTEVIPYKQLDWLPYREIPALQVLFSQHAPLLHHRTPPHMGIFLRPCLNNKLFKWVFSVLFNELLPFNDLLDFLFAKIARR